MFCLLNDSKKLIYVENAEHRVAISPAEITHRSLRPKRNKLKVQWRAAVKQAIGSTWEVPKTLVTIFLLQSYSFLLLVVHPAKALSTKTGHRVTFDLVITSCTLCTIQSAQTQSDKSMEELYMPRHLNALSDMEQGHSGFPLSFLYLWMAKKLRLKRKIHHMVEVSSQSLFCSRQ